MTKCIVCFIVLAGLAFVGCSSIKVESGDASQPADDGMPFGKITDADTDQLMQFAKDKGFDLSGELEKAYAKDTNALANVFRFSLTFQSKHRSAS